MTSDKKNQPDSKLFKNAMADVRPLSPENRAVPMVRKLPAIVLQHENDKRMALNDALKSAPDPIEPEFGDQLLFLRPGYQKRLLRRLRKGQFHTSDSIDLHHMNQQTAGQVLFDFIAHSVQSGYRCVRVIHGKGLRSVNKPLIKALTNSLLSGHPEVVAFISCRPTHGGSGAVDVLLKSSAGQDS
jgi:DNA-nicking Smr family endonuclease